MLFARPGFLVRRLHQIHYALFFEECKSQNVTPVQYGMLTAVSVLPDLDQTSIAEEVGLDRTTTADVLKRLEDRGLIERRANPADKRTRHVRLTEEGARSSSRCAAAWRARRSVCWSRCVRPSATMFMDLMRILVEAQQPVQPHRAAHDLAAVTAGTPGRWR